jgi:hypothetical protein
MHAVLGAVINDDPLLRFIPANAGIHVHAATAKVFAPSRMLFVTRGESTQHRPVE